MQPDDLADPQPQAGHTQNHRSVTQPALRRRIQRADQLLERSRIQIPDETAPPVRHHRDRGLQPVPAQTFGPQEPEERPQRGCHQLQSPRVVSPCRHPDETDHVTDADPLHLDLAIGKHPLQEPTGEPGVILRVPTQTPRVRRRCSSKSASASSTDHPTRTDMTGSLSSGLDARTTKKRCDYVQLRDGHLLFMANPHPPITSISPRSCT